MGGLISFDEAQARLAAAVVPLGSEEVPLAGAAGRVLAAPLHARTASPRRAVSAMDGYAVVDAATAPGAWLEVVGEAWAGHGYPGRIGAGQAVAITTGAPLPDGADRCIVQEHAEREGKRVRFTPGYGPGRHVRAAASDFAAGDLLLAAGTRLSPRAMIAAAAADRAEIAVGRQPRVAILGTGDELAAPGGAHLRRDAIPESVTFGVAAMVAAAGGLVIARALAPDSLPDLERLAGESLEQADLVIVTGGASVGARDFARTMFAPHGLETIFSKVAIKPGKPVWLGRARSRWVLGLPGNPTSAMVAAALFLRPLLAGLQGADPARALRWRPLPLAASLAPCGDRETFERARWDDAGLSPVTRSDSGLQAPLPDSDWLIRRTPGAPAARAGDWVSALAF